MERGEDEKKIVVVGHRGCGKTCFIASFVDESPVDVATQREPGHIRKTTRFSRREKLQVVLREVDADPHRSFVRALLYEGASAILVCFSFDDFQSMGHLAALLEEARWHSPLTDLTVVGCKADKKQQTVASVREWMNVEGVITPHRYLECSAKTGDGVSHVVRVVGKALLDRQRRFDPKDTIDYIERRM